MKNKINLENKINNNPNKNKQPQANLQIKIKNSINLINKNRSNNPQINNNIKNNNNNFNQNNNNLNDNIAGKKQKIKKIIQNFGIFKVNCFNQINDYNNNLLGPLDKQYTPNIKNENDNIQLFNYNLKGKNSNNINIKEQKDNNIEYIKFHKRSKSTNKPVINLEQAKNKKLVIKNQKPNNNDFNNFPLINKDKNDLILKNKNYDKKNKKNIKIINISPDKKKISSVNTNLNNIQKEIKNPNKNVNINKNNNNIQSNNIIENNNINNNINNNKINNNINNEVNNQINNQITIETPPYISQAIYVHPNTQYRQQMEDFHKFVILSFQNFRIAYFSIFDGHGGNQVSIFLRDFFHQYLLQELKTFSFSNDSELNKKNIISSINNSFEKIDKDIIENKNFKNEIGSTGTIILLYRDPNNPLQRVIICANVGDSKGYIINKNNINQITKDHNCKDENEVTRIKNNKGLVFQGRVFGSLMLTRSFGDKELKEYGVLSTPDIFSNLINDNDLYAIIGSDGVWDVISQEDLFELSKEKKSSKELCQKIVITSLERHSQDNISCFVVKLNE